jgi:hypothetical protein
MRSDSELRHHCPGTVEQQSADRVGRIVDESADAEFDALDGEFVIDVFRISEGAGRSIEFGNHEVSPFRQSFSKSRVVLSVRAIRVRGRSARSGKGFDRTPRGF